MSTKLCVCSEFITCPWFLKSFALYDLSVTALEWDVFNMMLQIKTFYPKAWPFCFMKAVSDTNFLWGLAPFWGGQYFDCFAINQWISIFSAFNMGTMGKSNKETADMVWLDVYPMDIAPSHATARDTQVVGRLCCGERVELSISTHTGWNKTV